MLQLRRLGLVERETVRMMEQCLRQQLPLRLPLLDLRVRVLEDPLPFAWGGRAAVVVAGAGAALPLAAAGDSEHHLLKPVTPPWQTVCQRVGPLAPTESRARGAW